MVLPPFVPGYLDRQVGLLERPVSDTSDLFIISLVGTMSTRPDVQPLLDAAFDYAVAEYGKRGFKFWKDLIGDQINLPHPDDRGKQIEIMPMWYKKLLA